MSENVIPPEPPFIQEAEIVPEPPVQQPQPAPEPKVEHKYRVVRAEGDPIFLIDKENKRHWILNAKAYKELGYKFGEEQKIPQSELATYMPGEAITMENVAKYK